MTLALLPLGLMAAGMAGQYKRGQDERMYRTELSSLDSAEPTYIRPTEDDPEVLPHWEYAGTRYLERPPEYVVQEERVKQRRALHSRYGKSKQDTAVDYAFEQWRSEQRRQYLDSAAASVAPLYYDDTGLPRNFDEATLNAPDYLRTLNSHLFSSDRDTEGNLVRVLRHVPDPRPDHAGKYARQVVVIDPETGRARLDENGNPRTSVITANRSSDPDDAVLYRTPSEWAEYDRNVLRGVSPAFAKLDGQVRGSSGSYGLLGDMYPMGQQPPVDVPPSEGAGSSAYRPGDARGDLPLDPTTPSPAPSTPLSVTGTQRGLAAERDRLQTILESDLPRASAQQAGYGSLDEVTQRVSLLDAAIEQQAARYRDVGEEWAYSSTHPDFPVQAHADADATAARVAQLEELRRIAAQEQADTGGLLRGMLRTPGVSTPSETTSETLRAAGFENYGQLEAELQTAREIQQRQGGAREGLGAVPVWEGSPPAAPSASSPRSQSYSYDRRAPLASAGDYPAPGSPQYEAALLQGIEGAVERYNLPHEGREALLRTVGIESTWGRNNVGAEIGTEISGDPVHNGDRARGPFQFMPRTAAQYGLRDPMDPVAAADAAARHLIDAYNAQGQNWGRAAIGHHSGAGWTNLGENGIRHARRIGVDPRTGEFLAYSGPRPSAGGVPAPGPGPGPAPAPRGLGLGGTVLSPEQEAARREAARVWTATGRPQAEAEGLRHFDETGYFTGPKAYGDAEGNSAVFDAGGNLVAQTTAPPVPPTPAEMEEAENNAAKLAFEVANQQETLRGKQLQNMASVVEMAFGAEYVKENPGVAASAIRTLDVLDAPADVQAVSVVDIGKRVTDSLNEKNKTKLFGFLGGTGTQYADFSAGVAVGAAGLMNAPFEQQRKQFVVPIDALMEGEVVQTQEEMVHASTVLSLAYKFGKNPTEATAFAAEAVRASVDPVLVRYGLEVGVGPAGAKQVAVYAAQGGRQIRSLDDFRREALALRNQGRPQ